MEQFPLLGPPTGGVCVTPIQPFNQVELIGWLNIFTKILDFSAALSICDTKHSIFGKWSK